jgi:hypothetical protein
VNDKSTNTGDVSSLNSKCRIYTTGVSGRHNIGLGPANILPRLLVGANIYHVESLMVHVVQVLTNNSDTVWLIT